MSNPRIERFTRLTKGDSPIPTVYVSTLEHEYRGCPVPDIHPNWETYVGYLGTRLEGGIEVFLDSDFSRHPFAPANMAWGDEADDQHDFAIDELQRRGYEIFDMQNIELAELPARNIQADTG